MPSFTFSQLACGALAAASVLSPVAATRREQSVFDWTEKAGFSQTNNKDCKPQNVTFETDFGKNFVMRDGWVTISDEFNATVWTLEKDNFNNEAWKIYVTLPDNNRQYWYYSTEGIRLGTNGYSADSWFVKFIDEDEEEDTTGHDDDGKDDLPEAVVLYTGSQYYLSYNNARDRIDVKQGSFPELALIKPEKVLKWKSLAEKVC